jgi:Sugar-specific transcriptional regulator TrmB
MQHVMSLGPFESYFQIIIPILVPFLVGLVFGTNYKKIRAMLPKWHDNTSTISAIVSEYTRRLTKYESTIAELRARMDVIESRGQNTITQQLHSTASGPRVSSSDISPPDESRQSMYEYHKDKKIEPIIEISDSKSGSYDIQNGTTEYVLRLLNDRPMTSREVQQAIGRSREHTSRLMKRLHEYGFVNRDTSTKPFKYALAEGRRLQSIEEYHVTKRPRSDISSVSHGSH